MMRPEKSEKGRFTIGCPPVNIMNVPYALLLCTSREFPLSSFNITNVPLSTSNITNVPLSTSVNIMNVPYALLECPLCTSREFPLSSFNITNVPLSTFRMSPYPPSGAGTDLRMLILSAVLFTASRDALAKYYTRTGRLRAKSRRKSLETKPCSTETTTESPLAKPHRLYAPNQSRRKSRQRRPSRSQPNVRTQRSGSNLTC